VVNHFRYIALRQLRERPARTILTVLGVACGIALYVAITIINESTLQFFKDSVNAVAGKATLIVSAGETGFDEGVAEKLEKVPGVTHAVPVLETRAWLLSTNETLMVLGVDLLQEKAVRSYKTTGKKIIGDALSFITQPDSLILTETFARTHGLKEGDTLELSSARGKSKFTVRGMLSPTGLATAYGGAMAIMDIDGARIMFGKEGKLDRVDIVTAEGADLAQVEARVREIVGPGLNVERPELQSEQMERMTRSFQVILSFFATLALIVGIFLVANSVAMSVAERRKETGTLRALGTTRRGVLTIFVSEALAMGTAGALIGAFLGRGLASVMVGAVTKAMTSQYQQKIDVSDLNFGPRHVLTAVAIGAISAVMAALWPSIKAALIQPVHAMKAHEMEEDEPASGGSYAMIGWTGVALLLFATAALFASRRAGGRSLEMAMQLSAVLGSALVGPAVVGGLVRLLRPMVRARSWTVVRLAQDNLLRNPRRTGSNVMTLMVGLMLVIMIASVNTSFKVTLISWYSRILNADLVVSTNGRLASHQSQPLHEELRPRILGTEGVAGTFGIRQVKVKYGDKSLVLKAFDDPSKILGGYPIFEVEGADATVAGRELYDAKDPVIMVSQGFVNNHGKKTGDTIELLTPAGLRPFRIVATVVDFAAPGGVLYMSRPRYRELFRDDLVSAYAVKVKEGADPVEVRTRLDRAVSREYKLTILSNADLRAQITRIVDDSFGYAATIEAAALLVALFGLLNTLLISVMERTRELGMLRAVGMSRGQLARMIVLESASQGGLGAAVAIAIGTFVASIWVSESLGRTLGWEVNFHFPWAAAWGTFAMGLAVSAFAAWYPAHRAARLDIVEALDYE
jgi:putative ABC transport system permease protein